MVRVMSIGFWLVGVAAISAQEAPKFKPLILPDAIRFVSIFSEDKQVGSMLFDNFILGTGPGRGGSERTPNAEVKKFTYVLQPESKGEVCVLQQIRGYLSTTGSGGVALVIHAAGKTTLVDLTKAIQTAKVPPKSGTDDVRAKAKLRASEEGFTVDARPSKSDDFLVEIKSHVAVSQSLQTTLLTLVDRVPGEEGAAATIHIDSVDFTVLPLVKGK